MPKKRLKITNEPTNRINQQASISSAPMHTESRSNKLDNTSPITDSNPQSIPHAQSIDTHQASSPITTPQTTAPSTSQICNKSANIAERTFRGRGSSKFRSGLTDTLNNDIGTSEIGENLCNNKMRSVDLLYDYSRYTYGAKTDPPKVTGNSFILT